MRKEVVVVAALTMAATVVVVAEGVRRWKRRKERQWKKTQRILRKFARECAISVPNLWEMANSLMSDMEASLHNDHQKTTKLDMLVSYVASLPNGDEKGLYYGVNLKATSFIILCARLGGKTEPITELHKEEIFIPFSVIQGTSQELCDYMAVEIEKFVAAHPENDNDTSTKAEQKILGFIVSYPVEQSVLSFGSAIKWKNFSADDAVGKGLVIDINHALEKQGLNMRVCAVVDESIGNLGGGRYYNRDCTAAVTLGLRTNAAYIESPDSVPEWKTSSPKSGEPVISTEWGGFCSSLLPVTEHDASLDAESSNPGSRIFEKLVSGIYLGEIVRRVLLKMAQDTAIFGDTVPPKLTVPYILKSPDMAAMHQDTSEDYEGIGEKLKDIFEITDSTQAVREVVAEVCDIVTERGARLVAAGIVGIIKKLGRIEMKRSVVIVEGGLYEHYRVFRNYLHSSVWEMLGNELSDNIILEHSHGCSGAGALFLAASQTQNPMP